MLSYNVDLVLCIDCTGSMSEVIHEVKARALSFPKAISDRVAEKHRSIASFRLRVIGFRDFWEPEPAILELPFIDLRSRVLDFEIFLGGIEATGGGDEPESALEAVALAIGSEWGKGGQNRWRHVVVVWTDDKPHPFEKALRESASWRTNHGYPTNMPRNLNELTDRWNALPEASRRLLLYAPEVAPWTTIRDNWSQVIHFPSKAGQGLKEHEFDAILDAIGNSL